MRTGWGFDVQRFGGEPPVLFAGVPADQTRGLLGTSDADVVAHAVADALLGAAALGDVGMLFPSSDPHFEGADSMELLRVVVDRVHAEGLRVAHLDVTVVAESVRLAPIREAVRAALARALAVETGRVSVKATTTDGLGFLGRDEGIAATAIATCSARDEVS